MNKPKTYARTLIEVKRIHDLGTPGFRDMAVTGPKFTIGQKVWRHICNNVEERVIRCPVCKERHVKQKKTPVIERCEIKGVHLYVTDSALVIQYIVDCDRVVDESRLFLMYNDAAKDAYEEIETIGKVSAKKIAAVKEGIKNYRANIRK